MHQQLYLSVAVVLTSFAIVCAAPSALPTQQSTLLLDDEIGGGKLAIGPGDKSAVLNPYPSKRRLTFRVDGSFRLTVFSDLHFGENPWDDWGPEQDRKSLKAMKTLLASERPDYVVLNGDLITGENTFRENSTALIDQIVQPLNEVGVPFSSTHGNHDNQANITHLEEIHRELAVAPLSYTRPSPPGIGGEGGPGNYWVPIFRATHDRAPALVLWFFDSRGGRTTSEDNAQMPDWVDSSVAGWIAAETAVMDDIWGIDANRNALAFVHIPPHAIEAVQRRLNRTESPGLNDDELGRGSTQATEKPASAGKDGPFWDALNKHVRNLRAVVSGHDHGNEWCAKEPEKGVTFCFDKHSGYGGYSSPGWGRGVRSFEFKHQDGHQVVETYIRMENGQIKNRAVLHSDSED